MKKSKKIIRIGLVAVLFLAAVIAILAFGRPSAARQTEKDVPMQMKELPAVMSFHLPLPSEWNVTYYECVLPAPGDHIAFAEISCAGGPPPTMFTWKAAADQDVRMIRDSMQELNMILENEGFEPISSQYLSINWENLPLFLEEPDNKILRFCYLAYDKSRETVYMLARD